MTKIIAIPLFVALLLATHIYAAEPSTGATLGAKTPHIAEKHPEALTDGRSSSRFQEMCALPASDVHGRARLMNEASHAEEAALDAATDALLGRLTADGSSRVQALVQSEIKNRSSVAIDWEGIATDLPQVMEGIAEGACDRYEVMVGIEAVLAKGRVDSL